MIKLAKKIVRFVILAVVIVILANRIQWAGSTVSDKIESTMARAELEYHQSPLGPTHLNRAWSSLMGTLSHGLATAHSWVQNKKASYARKAKEADSELIQPNSPGQTTERQKLRALIDELNRSSN